VANGDVIARDISSALADLAVAFEDGRALGRSITTNTAATFASQGVRDATKRIVTKRDQLEVAMRAVLREDELGRAVDESTACSTRLDEYHLDKNTGEPRQNLNPDTGRPVEPSGPPLPAPRSSVGNASDATMDDSR
jgi:hypothetical protein